MPRNSTLVLLLALGLIFPSETFAQLVPPAGSAGAGSSAISGVPFGPANPSVLSDPSGIGNASRIPPLTPNRPAPIPSYGAVDTPAPRATLGVPSSSYTGASQRIISARQAAPKKQPGRRRSRPEVSSFTGICRGC
jgi:hypothetical protein